MKNKKNKRSWKATMMRKMVERRNNVKKSFSLNISPLWFKTKAIWQHKLIDVTSQIELLKFKVKNMLQWKFNQVWVKH